MATRRFGYRHLAGGVGGAGILALYAWRRIWDLGALRVWWVSGFGVWGFKGFGGFQDLGFGVF